MTEVQKRIAVLEAAVEDAGETIAAHGAKGLSSLDNVRRLVGDVSLACQETKKIVVQQTTDMYLYFYKDRNAAFDDAYPFFGDEPASNGYAIYNWLVLHPGGKVEVKLQERQ